MTNVDFLLLLYSNLGFNLFIVFSTIVAYYFLFGRLSQSFIDPLFLGFIAQSLSCSVVFILYFNESLDLDFLFSFVFTEIAFLIPLLFLKSGFKVYSCKVNEVSGHLLFLVFYRTCIFMLLLVAGVYFSLFGVPLFIQASRLDVMESAGVLAWFTDIYWVLIPSIVLIKRYKFSLRSNFDFPIIFICFLLLLLKGGKSDFVFLISGLFLAQQVFDMNESKRLLKILIYSSPVFILLVSAIVLTVWGSDKNVYAMVFERFILFGDVFYQGYNKDFLQFLPKDIGFFEYFFSGTVNKVRSLFSGVAVNKVVFGYEISKYYYGIESGIGPNARHNILGLYLFGPYFSVIFSFVLGLIIVAIRNDFFSICGKSPYGYMLYVCLNLYVFYFFVDPSLAIGLFIKFFFVLLVTLLISFSVCLILGIKIRLRLGRKGVAKI